MLQLEEALARILAAVPPPASKRIPLDEADGRVLAESALSPMALPPFDNSAMDGYAVRAEDVASAGPERPVRLRLVGRATAGEPFPGEVAVGQCVRVFTGSSLPRGADSVVMQENTQTEAAAPGEILIRGPVRCGENVRLRGEDVQRGQTLVEAGERLSAGRLSVLAAAGLAQVRVSRRPAIGLLATGSELKGPGQELAPGQIYESNRVGLAALIRRAGAIPRSFPLVTDALAATRFALAAALEQCDAVVTSGGVSVGEMDFIRSAFEALGGELQFWRVAMKPGRPFAFGRHGQRLLFGLPGNPVSALVTFLLLVRPALLHWQGAMETALPTRRGELTEPMANDGERRHFLRVKVDASGRVSSAGLQASHALSSLAAANGLLDVPPRTVLAAGTTVQVLLWD